MLNAFAVLLLVLNISNLQAYRFVCNGILADGTVRNDECGVCDNKRAARWSSSEVHISVANHPLPENISVKDWQEIVENSFKAWNDVSGSSLKLINDGDVGNKEFGSNKEQHEVFWITDKEKWRYLIGGGEFGTLGATLPNYICKDSGRVIEDADLVLNGIGHINWQKNCNSDDCIAVQTTLVHELGHFFGLDHPCLMCDNSVMTARAGFDHIYPMLDDMEGIRALYPDSNGGGLGFPCSSNKDCYEELNCVNDGEAKYCSNLCDKDSDCENGSQCLSNEYGNICAFNLIDNSLATVGENCYENNCQEPLICAGASSPNYYCYLPCGSEVDCEEEQKCISLNGGVSLCVTISDEGERCSHKELCRDDLYCVFEGLKSGFCRSLCVEHDDCSSGYICENIDDIANVCIPDTRGLNLSEGYSRFGENSDRGHVGNKKEQVSMGCSARSVEVNLWALIFIFAWLARFNSVAKKKL